jgi:hypothetical protein
MRIREIWEDFVSRVVETYRDYPANPTGFKAIVDEGDKYLLLASALLACLSKEQAKKIFKHFKI